MRKRCYNRAMADSISVPSASVATPVPSVVPRHSALVRLTHWITSLAFLALLITGGEIVISHPRFYWGETGNILTPALFRLPIPASRDTFPTNFGYVMPDQNGWSRYLHFQSAWVLVLAGSLYLIYGLFSGHFRKDLLPSRTQLSWPALSIVMRRHLRFQHEGDDSFWSYNSLQRITYLAVIFVFIPLTVWTGLAMSPAIASVCPLAVSILGGQQSARTIHFFLSIFLTLFLLVHVVMVCLTGFSKRMRAMILGRPNPSTQDLP